MWQIPHLSFCRLLCGSFINNIPVDRDYLQVFFVGKVSMFLSNYGTWLIFADKMFNLFCRVHNKLKEVCGIINNINSKEVWLNYFNNVLFEKGIIKESERNKMILLIKKNCHIPKRSDNS